MSHFLDKLNVEGLTTSNSLCETPTSNATTTNGTLTLVVASTKFQVLTGVDTGFSVVLPNATTLINGWKYEISNTSTQPVLIKDGGGNTLFTLDRLSTGYLSLQSNGTTNGTWIFWQVSTSQIAAGIVN